MINKNELPQNWKIVKVKEIALSIQYGYTESSSTENVGPKFLRITDIQDNRVDWKSVPHCKISENNKGKYKLQDGDLVFARTGATVGKSFLIKGEIPDAIFASYLIRLRFPKTVSDKFVYNFFQSHFYWKQIVEGQVGIGQPNVNGTKLGQLLLTLPPLAEQERIVTKIEELFSELDAGLESLKTAQAQLKIYRQAVLKYAFEGKLTNNNIDEGELPSGWKLVTMNSVCNKIQDGSHFSPQVQYQERGMGQFPYITAKNIRHNYMDLSNVTYIDEDFHNSIYTRCNPEFGDVLLTKDGVNTGEVTLNTLQEPFSLLSSVCLFKTKKELLNASFLKYFIQSPIGMKNLVGEMTGTAIKRIILRKIKDAEITIPTLVEQQSIVEQIENRLSVCNKLEETINASLKQAESLRQSILKQAFEGTLVKPKETEKPKRTPFYQMQTLGLIVDRSRQRNIRHGEMTLAKYAFLADKIYGVPIYDKYERWHLGPYPTAIKKTVNNREYFRIENNTIRVLNEEKLFKYNNDYKQQIETAVDELAEIFSSFKPKDRPHKTELLATVCKVIEDIQTTDIESVRQSMAEWKIGLKDKRFDNKAEKFGEDETIRCVEYIVKKGWDKKLIR